MDLLHLAERCEKAAEPDRPLSWDIWEAIGKPKVDDWSKAGSAPAYTVSLDAAMTLAPEGWWLSGFGKVGGETFQFGLQDTFRSAAEERRARYRGEPLTKWTGSRAASSPALALCAAALRARAASVDRSGEASETRSGSTVGESAARSEAKGDAQTPATPNHEAIRRTQS